MRTFEVAETPEEFYQQQRKMLSDNRQPSKPDFKPCPFCGSHDVGGSALLGTMRISCYKCHAEVQFKAPGLSINEQTALFNKRPNNDE